MLTKGYTSDEYGLRVGYNVWVIVQGLPSRKSATHLVNAMYGCGAALVVEAVIKWSITAWIPRLVASSISAVIAMVRNTNQSSPSRLINTSSPSNAHSCDKHSGHGNELPCWTTSIPFPANSNNNTGSTIVASLIMIGLHITYNGKYYLLKYVRIFIIYLLNSEPC